MSLGRTVLVVVVTLALTTTLVTANAVAAAHLTVLDPDFVTEAIEEEGGYEAVEGAMMHAAGPDGEEGDGDGGGDWLDGAAAGDRQSGAGTAPGSGGDAETGEFDDEYGTDGVGGGGPDDAPVDMGTVMADAVTDDYVQSQTEANVERTYAYLHGNSDELNLSVATEPIAENASASVERQMRNASVADLAGAAGTSLGGPVNESTLERLTANESSYEAVRAEFRGEVRERVVDGAVDDAFRDADDDELLALVVDDYDPRAYSEEEKARMVAEREPEIRTALRAEVEREYADEVEAEVDARLAEIRAKHTRTGGETASERAGNELNNVVVRGLTGETAYDEFRADLDAARADLAAATADDVEADVTEGMPERIDLAGNGTAGAPPGFQQARTVVVWFDRLTVLLPLVAVGLLGLLYRVTRSATTVASAAGWSLLVAGGPTAVAVAVVRPRLESLLAGGGSPDPMATLMAGVLDRGLAVVGNVSLAMALGGLLVLAGVLAVQLGVLDGVLSRLGDDGPESRL